MTTKSYEQQLNYQDEHEKLKRLMEEKININNSLKIKYIRAKKKIKMLMFEREYICPYSINQFDQQSVEPEIEVAPIAMTTLATRDNRRVTSPGSAEDIATVPSAPPKRSRINKHNMKTRRVQPIRRDEQGNPVLPQKIGVLTVTNLGRIVTDREAFHTERYIFPVGYTVQRIYPSMIDPVKNTLVTSTIIDSGGGGPKFQIIAADQPNDPIIANSATGAWTVVVRKTNEIRQRDHSNSASGPDYYGFKHPTIAKMIQDLPGARELKNYLWQNFEEMEPRAAKGVMAAAEKKRGHLEQMGQELNSPRQEPTQQDLMEQMPESADKHLYHEDPSPHYPLSSQESQYPAHHHHLDVNMSQSFISMESDQEIDELDDMDSA
ncbi:hypothetical protein [Parasitella parasitica]|uniref:FYR N-terminal domain-containing protein n=1 Tax=Parasitella parasitica TaxID=35722 RepID=A0A0B7N2X8_9FUNG|nr:hypothetical protein [Parasitella parasitica]